LIDFSIFSVGADSPTSGGVAMMTYFVLYTMIFNGGQGPCVGVGGDGSGGGGRGALLKILVFPLCSQSCFSSSQCVAPNMFPIAPHLSSFHLCRWAKGDALYIKTCKI
jgi:hypothetical protein